jgi:hypothetical protein
MTGPIGSPSEHPVIYVRRQFNSFPIQVRFSMSGSAQLLLKNASVGEYQRK